MESPSHVEGPAGFRLGPPSPARQLVLRSRLLDVLQQRFRRRLTVVVAGPGFGKTTLLTQARAENQLDPHGVDVWLTCHDGDGAVSTLAEGLTAALRRPGSPVWDLADAIERICAAVWRCAPEQVALILDDAHLIPAGSPSAQLLVALLDRLPHNGHLVLSGRFLPPVGTARLAAMGELVEIGEADLAFSYPERSEFAALRDVPADLLSDTAGWPALAELTASIGRHRVIDYLWEELLAPMPAQRRRMLALLALIGGADDEVAAALAEQPVDLAKTLAGLPLVAGVPGSWRSLHPLWAPALGGELTTAEQAAARVRAARVMRARGDVDAAMRQLALAGAWDQVRDLCCETAALTHPEVPPDVLAGWYDLLSPEQRDGAEGHLLLGLIERSADLHSALASFERAAEAYQESGNLVGEISANTHVGHLSWWLNDDERLAAGVQRGEELVTTYPFIAPLILLREVWRADVRGDFARGLDLLAQVPPNAVSPPMSAGVNWLWGWMYMLIGEPERARPYADRSVAAASGTFRAAAVYLRVLSGWLCGDVDQAVRQVPELAQATIESGRALGDVFERSHCALLLAYRGDLDDARVHLDRARISLPGATGASSAEIAYALAQVATLLLEGREEDARTALGAELARRPLQEAGRARIHRLFPALSYVLAPETRELWHERAVEPTPRRAVELAAVLVAARERGSLQEAAKVDLPGTGVLRSVFPLPWAVEFAVAIAAAGRPEGAELMEALGPGARPLLRALTTSTRGRTARAARELTSVLPTSPAARLELCVLGPLELRRNGRPVDHPSLQRDRVRQLLLFMVARRSASRHTVAVELWPDLGLDAAGRNLRVTLNYTQRLLEPERTDGDPPFFLRTDGGILRLTTEDALTVDAWQFDRLLDEAVRAERQGAPSLALKAYRQALPLYRGDYLADVPQAEWATVERERLRVRYVTGSVRAGELLLAAGDDQEALGFGHAALRVDRWAESAYRLLIAVHLERGELDAGRRVLEQCLRMLAELGARPDAPTEMIARRLGRVLGVGRSQQHV